MTSTATQKPVEEVTPDPNKEPKKSEKQVPMSDLVAVKSSAKRQVAEVKAQLEEAQAEIASLNEQLQVAKVSGADDEDVKAIQAHLLAKNQTLENRIAEHKKVVAATEKREKAAKAKELVLDYKERGLELDADLLLAEDDMEAYVQDQYIKHLEAQAAGNPSEPKPQVFESSPTGVTKKMPADMNPQEFAEYLAGQKREASLRR